MEDEQGRQDLGSSSDTRPPTFAEMADKLCTQYMAMGVPYDEYWYGDYTQLAYYHKAFELRRERNNRDAWLQGAYVYDAICMASPLLHAFRKSDAKPIPYHKEPYGAKPIEADSGVETQEKPNADVQALNASARFASFMTQWNKRFANKGGDTDGTND